LSLNHLSILKKKYMPPKILSADQIRKSDAYTVLHEPIASINLMERASLQFVRVVEPFIQDRPTIYVFCGPGNNGGDGFAVARILREQKYNVKAYYLQTDKAFSKDCQANFERFENAIELSSSAGFPKIQADCIVIDALLGSGCSRPSTGLLKELIQHLNESQARILSIDIPSGLPCDQLPFDATIIHAHFTGTFEYPKLSFFLKESTAYAGKWSVLPIGLNKDFEALQQTPYHYLTTEFCAQLIRKREKFSHKGTYGHGLLLAGSKGKMGAAVLSAQAALRSGIGLLTAHVPACGYAIMQTAVPEAMCDTDWNTDVISVISRDLSPFSAIGIGPGIGTEEGAQHVLQNLFSYTGPLVIDADALNILATDRNLLDALPVNAILTPHPKEFERLSSPSATSWIRLEKQRDFSMEHQCIVVLKDAITSISFPDGHIYFNTTGNPGMATGGTGDVLTGIITGLLAQGYSHKTAVLLGVFYHGKAGDAAAAVVGEPTDRFRRREIFQVGRLK
jgi:hydroxyethylthiazole kinase-like uncharacterized protein yjeF